MIISCHIPKTAGTTFGRLLGAAFGARLLLDYGDLLGDDGPEAEAHRAERRNEVRQRAADIDRSYDAIHGHFRADKYHGLFRSAGVCVFFREPAERVLSSYYYLLRNPQIPHPLVRRFHEVRPTLEEFVARTEGANIQARFLGGLRLDDLAFCGITEDFDLSLALFNRRFGTNLRPEGADNVNPRRSRAGYEISGQLRELIRRHHRADFDLYAAAVARFTADCRQLLGVNPYRSQSAPAASGTFH